MIFKLSILAALVAPLVSALTVSQPTQAVSNGGQMTFTWQVANGDPSTFSVYLQNPTFNSVYAVANNVDASKGTLTIAIPAVPDNQQYNIILVPIDNVNNVLAQSPSFTIGANTATTSSTAASSATTGRTSLTLTNTATRPSGTTNPGVSTSAFGTIVSNTATSASASASGQASPSGSNSAALPVRFNLNLGVATSMVLSVFAGAAVIAL